MENCVCILHNLSYQLETECPDCFRKYQPLTNSQLEKSPVGCFSPKSSKVQKEVGTPPLPFVVPKLTLTTPHLLVILSSQFAFDIAQMPEDNEPSGASWLCHPNAMQTYLNLLGLSQKDGTLEASCGALQNLTASQGPVRTKR